MSVVLYNRFFKSPHIHTIGASCRSTLPHRRKDLAFLCNCIPSRHLRFDSDDGVTVATLHFGVSNPPSDKVSLVPTPQLNSSPESPSTVIYGRHASTLGGLLQRDGIPVTIASGPQEVQAVASRKIAWSSLMWLMCHSEEQPMTVKDVHQFRSKELRRLVEEVLPSLEALTSESWSKDADGANPTMPSLGSVQDVLDYLESYSMSIDGGNVIPSKKLALREIQERNGLLLSLANESEEGTQQIYHMELIRKVVGEEALVMQSACSNQDKNMRVREALWPVKCASSDLQFLFRADESDETSLEVSNDAKSAVVVGAGMLGSSIAYHLSTRGVNVTVLDQRTSLLPPEEGSMDIDPGTATSSSFAWLNANDKSPMPYKQFNQLGMETWRRHDVLKDLPAWCGTLVRSSRQTGESGAASKVSPMKSSAYYSCYAVTLDEARRLEPGVEWVSGSDKTAATVTGETDVHFYPEEGQVDPVAAVKVLRLSARNNGVKFVEGAETNQLVRDDRGKVVGIEYTAGAQTAIARADTVVIAAGSNSSDPLLGVGPKHLRLLHQPGALAYIRSKSSGETMALERIFVDTVAQAHMLCRSDGIIVAGGGQLVVGGGDDTSLDVTIKPSDGETIESIGEEDSLIGNDIATNALAAMTPSSTDCGFDLVKVVRANRPMPCDGLPVIGSADQGLYVAVTHSGITLGPLIGELVAHEVATGSIFQILDHYRPSQRRTS